MPHLKRPMIDVVQGCEYDEIQRIVFAMILKISNLTIHPLVGRE